MTVYVILGEYGEYSGRMVFVCGVYDTRTGAETAVLAAAERRRVWELWNEIYLNKMEPLTRHLGDYPVSYTREALQQRDMAFDAIRDKVRATLPPEPPHVLAERFYITELPANEWDEQAEVTDFPPS